MSLIISLSSHDANDAFSGTNSRFAIYNEHVCIYMQDVFSKKSAGHVAFVMKT